MLPFLYFYFFGCFDLILMMRTDLKERWIDDRKNYFMMGIVASLYVLSGRHILFILMLIALSIFIRLMAKKMMAEGDLMIIQWCVTGIGITGTAYLFVYLFFLVVYMVLQSVLAVLYGAKETQAGIMPLFGAFFTTACVYVFSGA